MLKSGLTITKITQLSHRAFGTVEVIKKANSLKEYQNLIKQRVQASKTPIDKKPETQTESKSNPENKTDLIEVLEKINKTLERLAQAWEKPIKKDSFFDKFKA